MREHGSGIRAKKERKDKELVKSMNKEECLDGFSISPSNCEGRYARPYACMWVLCETIIIYPAKSSSPPDVYNINSKICTDVICFGTSMYHELSTLTGDAHNVNKTW